MTLPLRDRFPGTKNLAHVTLGCLPTPVEPVPELARLLGLQSFFVKRDDISGCAYGGNKVRKLEYLLADAVAHDATHVLTCGGEQSNHARATALAAAPNGTSGFVTYSGALGTPTQGVLSAATGLPISTGVSGLGTGVATALASAVTGSGGAVLATGPTISGATLSGTATISNAPILSALTGYVYANAGSAATASTTIPSTAFSKSTNETPTGSLNGSNTTFTLAHTPLNSSLEFYLNGQLLRPGASYDYTLATATVTMNFAPASSMT